MNSGGGFAAGGKLSIARQLRVSSSPGYDVSTAFRNTDTHVPT